MGTAYGFDTAATVNATLASSAKSKFGTPSFWGRYLVPSPYPMSTSSAVGEIRAMWDYGARYLFFICEPSQSRLSGSTAMGTADATTFCKSLMAIYGGVYSLFFPTNDKFHVYLGVEAYTNLSAAYWTGWARYINGFDVSSHGVPLYASLYCSPPAATTNCSSLTSSGVPCFNVWSNAPEPCSGCSRPFGTLSWQPKTCSGYTTTMWQMMIDSCTGTCGGSKLPNVDLNMTSPSNTEVSYMMRFSQRP